jgi:hypothetical protein
MKRRPCSSPHRAPTKDEVAEIQAHLNRAVFCAEQAALVAPRASEDGCAALNGA